jgi:hypothetical protein
VTALPERQRDALSALCARIEAHAGLLGAVLVGSMVTGKSDALSDLDCIVVTANGAFGDVWADRCCLHELSVTVCWDHWEESPADSGAHKWLDSNLILVECLITAPNSGVRLAPPHRVVAGPDDVVAYLEPRPPVNRGEMRGIPAGLIREVDVETAYDILKEAVRRHRQHL